jgi:predicted short-subunit dehydrogenase-like oxidoreductase (DUF2520 family)
MAGRGAEPDPSCTRPRLGLVGGGRLGGALASALAAAGAEVHGPLGRSELPSASVEAVILCVPDAEIPDAAAAVAETAPFVGHMSGATPLEALAPARATAFGLHPLQTFVTGDGPGRFVGAGCAVAGENEAALALATGLAKSLRMRPFALADADRAVYHAGASIASNFLVTLQAAAEDAVAAAGLDPAEARELLAPLVRATVDNWAAHGPERALTGPVARGDDATVERQREALEDRAPHLLEMFDALAERTRFVAGREALR